MAEDAAARRPGVALDPAARRPADDDLDPLVLLEIGHRGQDRGADGAQKTKIFHCFSAPCYLGCHDFSPISFISRTYRRIVPNHRPIDDGRPLGPSNRRAGPWARDRLGKGCEEIGWGTRTLIPQAKTAKNSGTLRLLAGPCT